MRRPPRPRERRRPPQKRLRPGAPSFHHGLRIRFRFRFPFAFFRSCYALFCSLAPLGNLHVYFRISLNSLSMYLLLFVIAFSFPKCVSVSFCLICIRLSLTLVAPKFVFISIVHWCLSQILFLSPSPLPSPSTSLSRSALSQFLILSFSHWLYFLRLSVSVLPSDSLNLSASLTLTLSDSL